jgi:FtsP/CotA-like multicopper oxidase with cupredoxin domain
VIATDGGLLDRPRRTTALDLGPGERLEVLVDFSREPLGRVVTLESLPFRIPTPMGGMAGPSAQGASIRLVRFEVERAGGPAARIPDRLARLDPFPAARAERTRAFALEMGPGMMGGPPTINGRVFDAGRVDERVPGGALELWEVSNLSTMPHPFHAHGVQFEVLERSGAGVAIGPQDLGLKDTVLLWPNERVRLGVRVGPHRGLFVLHCHNLEHEDAGMMSLFEIV